MPLEYSYTIKGSYTINTRIQCNAVQYSTQYNMYTHI